MLLKSFFGSRTRVKLMGKFLLHPKNEYFIRELTRNLKEQINSIRRELNNLKKVGLLKVRSRNRRKYYYINPDFTLLNEFKSIFTKIANPQEEIIKTIRSFGNVDLLILAGQFVSSEKSEIDMLVIGEIEKDRLKEYLENELSTSREVRFTILSRPDFLSRLDYRDKFVLDILSTKEKIVPINNLQEYIEARTKIKK